MPDMMEKLKGSAPAPSAIKQLRIVSGASLLLFIGFYVFFAMVFFYGAFFILLRTQENARLEFLAHIEQKEQELRPELIDQIIGLDANIKNLKTLLTNHIYPSQLFKLIEENAHPRVQFTSFNFAAGGRKIDMKGEASSYATIAQQLRIFEQNANVQRIDFGGLTASPEKNQVSFQVSLTVKPRALSR